MYQTNSPPNHSGDLHANIKHTFPLFLVQYYFCKESMKYVHSRNTHTEILDKSYKTNSVLHLYHLIPHLHGCYFDWNVSTLCPNGSFITCSCLVHQINMLKPTLLDCHFHADKTALWAKLHMCVTNGDIMVISNIMFIMFISNINCTQSMLSHSHHVDIVFHAMVSLHINLYHFTLHLAYHSSHLVEPSEA